MLISRLPPSLEIIQSQLEGTWVVIHFTSTLSLSYFISEFILASYLSTQSSFPPEPVLSFKGSLLLSALVLYCWLKLKITGCESWKDPERLSGLPPSFLWARKLSEVTLALNFMRPICVDNMMDCSASETEDLQGKILKNVSALPDGRERGVTDLTAVIFPVPHPLQI